MLRSGGCLELFCPNAPRNAPDQLQNPSYLLRYLALPFDFEILYSVSRVIRKKRTAQFVSCCITLGSRKGASYAMDTRTLRFSQPISINRMPFSIEVVGVYM